MKPHRPLATVLLAALLLAGCGDNDKDPESDDPTTSSSPSPTDTAVEPADGPRVDEPTFSFHAPDGWELEEPYELMTSTFVGAAPEETPDRTSLEVATKEVYNFSDVAKLSPDVLGGFRIHARTSGRVEAVTEWAGKPAYHLVGTGSLAGHLEEFGFLWKAKWITVKFDFSVAEHAYPGKKPEYVTTPESRQALIEAVEASWEWK